jgi:hypothetical protein
MAEDKINAVADIEGRIGKLANQTQPLDEPRV